jgi:hypothetical protein
MRRGNDWRHSRHEQRIDAAITTIMKIARSPRSVPPRYEDPNEKFPFV